MLTTWIERLKPALRRQPKLALALTLLLPLAVYAGAGLVAPAEPRRKTKPAARGPAVATSKTTTPPAPAQPLRPVSLRELAAAVAALETPPAAEPRADEPASSPFQLPAGGWARLCAQAAGGAEQAWLTKLAGQLQLTGVFLGGDRPLARIDGQLLGCGDEVGAFRIEAIDGEGVLLRLQGNVRATTSLGVPRSEAPQEPPPAASPRSGTSVRLKVGRTIF